MEPQTSGVKTWQWVVTIIVIIVLIVIGVLVFGGEKTEAPTNTDTASSTDQTNALSLNRIVMSDQYPGNVVYLSSVQVEKPSWVVIQADKNGEPGDIIGSTYFTAGINPGKITLTKPTLEGATYYAVIYTDDGDGKFDAKKDLPLEDSNGNVIMKIFRASASVGQELKG